MKKIHTEKAPVPVGPYSQGILYGNFLFTAGQVGIDPQTGKLVEGFENQVRQCLKNLEAVLNAAGASKCSIVKVSVFLTDISKFAEFNAIYEDFLKDCPVKPARSVVEVSALPLGAEVEVECIAVRG
ncbi:2-iminobutanoate/2-iminopropanoate deaminase [Desulfurobacterium pacificum]|uniref:2-iminobutanoate/2-iminopropanoate deaminase n=1 Tax=Desulfurobacterium pacificum TaxID=240166 RepID=A0ABY1NJ08_9BACT|nr:RidA family protein [Desulfurobacterium pacificum]SMP11081.1 2-iminobutanoate/2-iminopropanoate deaminase [Desulfurobacterium pacificum]